MTKKSIRSIVPPVILSALFFLVVITPIDILGCRNRGLLAAGIALAGGLLAIAAMVQALIGKIRGRSDTAWPVVCALLYAIPALYIVLTEG